MFESASEAFGNKGFSEKLKIMKLFNSLHVSHLFLAFNRAKNILHINGYWLKLIGHIFKNNLLEAGHLFTDRPVQAITTLINFRQFVLSQIEIIELLRQIRQTLFWLGKFFGDLADI